MAGNTNLKIIARNIYRLEHVLDKSTMMGILLMLMLWVKGWSFFFFFT